MPNIAVKIDWNKIRDDYEYWYETWPSFHPDRTMVPMDAFIKVVHLFELNISPNESGQSLLDELNELEKELTNAGS